MNKDTISSDNTHYIETPVRPGGSPVKLDAILKKRMRTFMRLKISSFQTPHKKRFYTN